MSGMVCSVLQRTLWCAVSGGRALAGCYDSVITSAVVAVSWQLSSVVGRISGFQSTWLLSAHNTGLPHTGCADNTMLANAGMCRCTATRSNSWLDRSACGAVAIPRAHTASALACTCVHFVWQHQ